MNKLLRVFFNQALLRKWLWYFEEAGEEINFEEEQ